MQQEHGQLQAESATLQNLERKFIHELVLSNKGHNTVKNYRTDLQCFNEFLGPEAQVQPVAFSEFTSKRGDEYAKYLSDRYPQSSNSRRRRVQTLRKFFDYLVDQGLYPVNPVKRLVPSPKILDLPHPTPLIEIQLLWQKLKEEEEREEKAGNAYHALLALRNQVIVFLVYQGGLTVSQLAQVKREHIFIYDQAPRIMVTPPKRDTYTIPLPLNFAPLHQKYLQKLAQLMTNFKVPEFPDYLFNGNHFGILSGGLSTRGLELIFENFRHKYHLTLTLKSLRQSCIFLWLHKKISDKQMKEWLGLAPSYSFFPYKQLMDKHLYSDQFL
jgi:site-specific recombinase XerD